MVSKVCNLSYYHSLLNKFFEKFVLVLVLGNHDYRGNVTAQLSQILQKKDNRWLCQRSFILSTGETILLIHYLTMYAHMSEYIHIYIYIKVQIVEYRSDRKLGFVCWNC